MRNIVLGLVVLFLATSCSSSSNNSVNDGAAGAGGAAGGSSGSGGAADGAAGTGGALGSDAGSQNPMARINHPGDGETRQASAAVPFVGIATDPQDGTLTGASLVWTSDKLSQPFGTGEQFSATLPAGTHVITLTATDSDGNKGTASITLTLQ